MSLGLIWLTGWAARGEDGAWKGDGAELLAVDARVDVSSKATRRGRALADTASRGPRTPVRRRPRVEEA